MLRLKLLVARIFTSKVLSWIINKIFVRSIPNLRILGLRILNASSISNRTKNSFFFGLYESAELRMIQRHMSNNRQILELGASIGVVASYIGKFKSPIKQILVEVNPGLIGTIEHNLKLNGVENVNILNHAIAQDKQEAIWFKEGDSNVAGQVALEHSLGSVSVPSISLSKVTRDFGLRDYFLISDIEGSEYEFLIDTQSLVGCSDIIIELHEVVRAGRRISTSEMLQLLTQHGFSIRDQDGPVYYLKR